MSKKRTKGSATPSGANAGAGKSNSTVEQNPASRRNRLYLLGILAITFIVFIPSLKNGFTNYDDQLYVTENALITTLSGDIITKPVAGNYHPLTILSLALNFKISGLEPFSYHLVNLIFHLLNTLLVFYFASMISRGSMEVAVITALLFGIHPMHVESVAWVSERKDVLYAFFFIAGLITYLKYARKRNMALYTATWALFLLSGASKPAAVVFPLILLLVDYFQERKPDMKLILEKAPFFAGSFFFGFLTIAAQESEAIGSFEQYPVVERIMFASYGAVMYLVKMIFPFQMSALHPYPDTSNGMPLLYMAAPLILAALMGLVAYSAKKTRVVVFGFLFYLVSIALVLQFVSVGRAIIAERYTYLAYIGPALILGFGIRYVMKDKQGSLNGIRKGIMGAIALYFAVMCYLTFERTKVWENSQTLWSDVIGKYPGDWFAYVGRGNYYFENNDLQKAFNDYNKAIALKATVYDPFVARGNLYRRNRQYKEALEDYNQAIALAPGKPASYSDRGSLYYDMGKDELALADFKKALELKSDIPEVYNNIGSVFARSGDYQKGLDNFNKSLVLNPLFADAYLNRAILYTLTGRFETGTKDYDQYFKLKKNHATADSYYWRGMNEQGLKMHQEATRSFTEAIQLGTGVGVYYLKRSEAYKATGKKSESLKDALKARQLGVEVEESYINQLRN